MAADPTVLLTHMHPDHSNGLCDPSGEPTYKNAELLIHEKEVAHWLDDVAMVEPMCLWRRKDLKKNELMQIVFTWRSRTMLRSRALEG
jgi:glyoxylase-like metal-dependent hydrolase (beta-lactamase superfamily II)